MSNSDEAAGYIRTHSQHPGIYHGDIRHIDRCPAAATGNSTSIFRPSTLRWTESTNRYCSHREPPMSNWHRWPSLIDDPNSINHQFAKAESADHPDRFAYPHLRDGSDIVLASDYSGEHAQPEFQVLSFLVTTKRSLFQDWEAARLTVRKKYLTQQRRMSFKELKDALRINALSEFLEAASLLNGLLVCIAVEKSHSMLATEDCLSNLQ